MIIGFIKRQQFTKKQPVIVSDSINYLSAKFVFQTSEWDEMIKFAHFQSGDDVYDFLLDGDELPKEASLNLYAGNWKVYIHGDRYVVGNDGNAKVVERATTNSQEIKVVKYEKEGNVLPEISFDVAEQIAAVAEDAKRIATSVRNEADQGMFDGVSVTHKWDGTVLEVTSASGTSSADLKGQKGDKGEPGKDGYTPQKNVDYFDGKDGKPGTNGITPHIGDNENWWIGDTDTGVKAGGVNSWYDLADRPFGDVETEKTVVDEEVKFNASGQSSTFTFFPLVVGKKYKVTFDGIEYETVAKVKTEDLYGDGNTIVDIRYIGNHEENADEEPFSYAYITIAPQNTAGWVCRSKKSTTVPVKVIEVIEAIEPIPVEYLPKSVPYVVEGGEGTVEAWPETTYEFEEGNTSLEFLIDEAIYNAIVPNETYIVNWNGTEYECVGADASTLGATLQGAFLGNVGAMTGGTDTGEPFVIGVAFLDEGDEPQYIGMIMSADGSTSVTLSVSKGQLAKIQKLDERCLPETVATKAYVDEMLGVIENGRY